MALDGVVIVINRRRGAGRHLSAPLEVPRCAVDRLQHHRGWSRRSPRPFGALPNRSGLHPTCLETAATMRTGLRTADEPARHLAAVRFVGRVGRAAPT